MIQAIIFDLGGVLLRTEDPSPRVALAKRLGMTRTALEQLVFDGPSGQAAQMGTIPVTRHWENVRQVLGLAEDEMDDFLATFWSGDRMDSDLVNLARSLRGRYRVGLLSNAFSDLRHYLVQLWRIDDAFDHMVISAEVGLVKPDPAIYRLALDGLGVAPPEAVFIDDFPENVAGARAVGMTAIHFQSPHQARSELAGWVELSTGGEN